MMGQDDEFAEIARNMRKIAARENRNLQDHALDERFKEEKDKLIEKELDGLEKALSAAPSPDKGVESSELIDPSKLPVQRHVGLIDTSISTQHMADQLRSTHRKLVKAITGMSDAEYDEVIQGTCLLTDAPIEGRK